MELKTILSSRPEFRKKFQTNIGTIINDSIIINQKMNFRFLDPINKQCERQNHSIFRKLKKKREKEYEMLKSEYKTILKKLLKEEIRKKLTEEEKMKMYYMEFFKYKKTNLNKIVNQTDNYRCIRNKNNTENKPKILNKLINILDNKPSKPISNPRNFSIKNNKIEMIKNEKSRESENLSKTLSKIITKLNLKVGIKDLNYLDTCKNAPTSLMENLKLNQNVFQNDSLKEPHILKFSKNFQKDFCAQEINKNFEFGFWKRPNNQLKNSNSL